MTVCLKRRSPQLRHFLRYTPALTHYRRASSAPWPRLSFFLHHNRKPPTGDRRWYTALSPAFLNFAMRRRAASELPVFSKDSSSDVLPMPNRFFAMKVSCRCRQVVLARDKTSHLSLRDPENKVIGNNSRDDYPPPRARELGPLASDPSPAFPRGDEGQAFSQATKRTTWGVPKSSVELSFGEQGPPSTICWAQQSWQYLLLQCYPSGLEILPWCLPSSKEPGEYLRQNNDSSAKESKQTSWKLS